MRRATILTIGLLSAAFISAEAFGQSIRTISKEVLDSLANPVAMADSPMRFEQTKTDIGTIGEDDAPSTYEFHWHNDGREPLVITEVKTGCGCAVAGYDRRPVKSGEEGVISITYHPKGHAGFFNRKIQVFTQLSSKPSAVLELSGRVSPSARPVHNYPHAIGELRLKQMQVRMDGSQRCVESIEVLNAGDKPLHVAAERKLLPDYLNVECRPATIAAAETADIEISFDPTRVKGHLPERVPVILDGSELPPSRRTIYVIFE